jgi:hypothetical protein
MARRIFGEEAKKAYRDSPFEKPREPKKCAVEGCNQVASIFDSVDSAEGLCGYHDQARRGPPSSVDSPAYKRFRATAARVLPELADDEARLERAAIAAQDEPL